MNTPMMTNIMMISTQPGTMTAMMYVPSSIIVMVVGEVGGVGVGSVV